MIVEPITFVPLPQERVWGGRRLATEFGRVLPRSDRPYGESWEVVDRDDAQSIVAEGRFAGRTLHDLWENEREPVFGRVPVAAPRFPILVKLLDARDRLSIQVHPPPDAAVRLGGEPKTEIWYVVDADPGAVIHAGLRRGVDRASFERGLREGTTERDVHSVGVEPGDFIFIPSGRIHAIGAGLLILEIQQNSDTTYRVFDWNRTGIDGRPRQLHVRESLECIDFTDTEPALGITVDECLVECPFFRVERWRLDPSSEPSPHGGRVPGDRGEFAIFGVVEGRVRCGTRDFAAGDFFLVPAERGDGDCLLSATGGSPRDGGGSARMRGEGATVLRTTWGRHPVA